MEGRSEKKIKCELLYQYQMMAVEVKGHPITGHEGPTGGVEV
jgi:hypothetical protein